MITATYPLTEEQRHLLEVTALGGFEVDCRITGEDLVLSLRISPEKAARMRRQLEQDLNTAKEGQA